MDVQICYSPSPASFSSSPPLRRQPENATEVIDADVCNDAAKPDAHLNFLPVAEAIFLQREISVLKLVSTFFDFRQKS